MLCVCVCVCVCVCQWVGVFLEGDLVHFLLLSTVNTGAMDRGCGLHVCVLSCVFTSGFSRGPAAVEPDVSLPNTAQTSVSSEWFRYAVFGYFSWSILRARGFLQAQFAQAIRVTFTILCGCKFEFLNVKFLFACRHFLRRQISVWQLIKSSQTHWIICNKDFEIVAKNELLCFCSDRVTEWASGNEHHVIISVWAKLQQKNPLQLCVSVSVGSADWWIVGWI